MNYYEHHLGDYMRDTAHLSLVEEGVYRRLIDAYYVREKPLPEDIVECCKLARATSKAERQAVAYVLREFFNLESTGYHQKRCDEVIAKFRDKSEKAKRSANARWTDTERNANASETHSESHSVGNALQSPVTSNHRERHATRTRTASRKAPVEFAPDLTFALETIPDVDAAAEAARFKDYEFKTPRSDWPGTWRNWVRKCKDTGQYARKEQTKWM